MNYLGGKKRLSKHIVPIIETAMEINNITNYAELFVGGNNIITDLTIKGITIQLNDYNSDLMHLWGSIKNGWLPTDEWKSTSSNDYYTIGENIYNEIKKGNSNFTQQFNTFFMFQCSFGGMYKKGFARNKRKDDLYTSGIKRTVAKQQKMQQYDCKLTSLSYCDVVIDKKTLLYLDPPYKNTVEYKNANNFNHEQFWDYCREMVEKGHIVLISELKAPKDFINILEIDYKRGLKDKENKNIISKEKVFAHKSQLDLLFQQQQLLLNIKDGE